MIYGQKIIKDSYLLDFYLIDGYIRDMNDTVLNENKFFDIIGKIFGAIKEGIRKFRKTVKEYTTKISSIISKKITDTIRDILNRVRNNREKDLEIPDDDTQAITKLVHVLMRGRYNKEEAKVIINKYEKHFDNKLFILNHINFPRKDKKFWDKNYLNSLMEWYINGACSTSLSIHIAEVAYYLRHKYRKYKDPDKQFEFIDYNNLMACLNFRYTGKNIDHIIEREQLKTPEDWRDKIDEICKYMKTMYPDIIVYDEDNKKGFSKIFTKKTDGTTFRKELENIPKLTEDELYKYGFEKFYDKLSLDGYEYEQVIENLLKNNGCRILKKNRETFETYADSIEKKLTELEDQIKQYVDTTPDNIPVKYITDYISSIRTMISDILLSLNTNQKVVAQLSMKAIEYGNRLLIDLEISPETKENWLWLDDK